MRKLRHIEVRNLPKVTSWYVGKLTFGSSPPAFRVMCPHFTLIVDNIIY